MKKSSHRAFVRLAAVWLSLSGQSCFAAPAGGEREKGVVEPVAFEEILCNEPGEWDARLTLETSRLPADDGAGASFYRSAVRGQLFFGLAKDLGGDISVPLVFRRERSASGTETAAGPGDMSFGLKYLLAGGKDGAAALAAMLEVGLPTGSEGRGLGEGSVEVASSLGWIKPFSGFTAQGTAGYAAASGGTEKTLLYNLSLAVPWGDTVDLFAELLGERGLGDGRDRIAAGPGVKYYISPELFLAAGVPFGVSAGAAEYRVITQVQYGF
jgi:hypothetical protein